MDDATFRRVHRRELAEDQVKGASQLARAALDYLGAFAGSCSADETTALRAALLAFARELQSARPNMAPIANLVGRWAAHVEALESAAPAELRREAAAIAQRLSDDSVAAVAQAASHAARWIGPGRTVLTHSMSSTVVETFRALARSDVRAIVTESRPGLEGRNQAAHLDALGIPVTFITEAQMGAFAAQADVALVGADTQLGDDSLVNKAGTYLLALAVRDSSSRMGVCCESFKQVEHGPGAFAPEPLDTAEIGAPHGRHISARNLAFDRTPAALIDAWIHETGVRERVRESPPPA
jgi:translation initiation factor eIF-2B subunit delta